MKIAKPIRDIYDEREPQYQRLKDDTRARLKPEVEEKRWFYKDRLKQLESFALKVETGRAENPAELEDFFACTVVVPTLGHIEEAVRLIGTIYEVATRRPPDDTLTHKQASDFMFDDLRLYVRRKPLASGRDADLDSLLFEIQVKTILQYAWGVATHDLIYKTGTISWPKERIAYQVKAMLEHAEAAIADAENLSNTVAVAKQNQTTKDLLTIIQQIREAWRGRIEELPADLKRLAETVRQLLAAADVAPTDLRAILDAEKRRAGFIPRDLSPYAFIVQAMAQSTTLNFERKFKRGHIKLHLVIHGDMDLPEWMKEEQPRILNLQKPPEAPEPGEAVPDAEQLPR